MLGKWFDGGVNLSGGEWQKVALGRAFMREAQILILDEPSAALDAKAEYELFSRLQQLAHGRTAIFISHRFSTVRQADRILVFEHGRPDRVRARTRSCWRSAGATRSCSISRPHRIAEAIRRRAPLAARTDLHAYRLFHGDAEGVPGLAVDRFGDVAVIHADARDVARPLAAGLRDGARRVRARPTRRCTRVGRAIATQRAAQLAPEEPAWGPPVDEVDVARTWCPVRGPARGGPVRRPVSRHARGARLVSRRRRAAGRC